MNMKPEAETPEEVQSVPFINVSGQVWLQDNSRPSWSVGGETFSMPF